ncbi:MAG: Holliday junction branch migration protein RuvA [Bacteroidetes bacterium]|nr:Holliday junction branch migration protein RuvA [Bacteroidota bacterium]HET6243215.1 Holliday junction branch migration protein RuvA [Bacteroidia bacterium]
MITHLEGKLVEKTPTYAVIDCGGVGYYLNISLNTFSVLTEGNRVKLFAHLHIVAREGTPILYGFADNEERNLFKNLISVSGIGPGTARMVLSSLNPREIIQAISNGDVTLLQRVKGVSLKSAQRLIVDLKDKLSKESLLQGIELTQTNNTRNEALSALVMLGFGKLAAEKAVDKAIKNSEHELLVEQLIKDALKSL